MRKIHKNITIFTGVPPAQIYCISIMEGGRPQFTLRPKAADGAIEIWQNYEEPNQTDLPPIPQ